MISDAQKAKATKHLDGLVSVGGRTITRRQFMEDLHRHGAKLTLNRERDYKAEEKLTEKIWRLGQRVPLGNPNHPETREWLELKNALKSGVYKEKLMIKTPDGTYYDVSKTEANYFESLR